MAHVTYESNGQVYVYGVDSEDGAWDVLHAEGLPMEFVSFDWCDEFEKRYLFTITYPSGEEEAPDPEEIFQPLSDTKTRILADSDVRSKFENYTHHDLAERLAVAIMDSGYDLDDLSLEEFDQILENLESLKQSVLNRQPESEAN